MTNISSKIGNKIERRKKEKKEFEKKYWKLPAAERLHYDNKLDELKDDSEFMSITAMLLKIIFVVAISFVLLHIYFPSKGFPDIVRDIIPELVSVLIFSFFTELLADSLIDYKRDEEIQQLNKRFGLEK